MNRSPLSPQHENLATAELLTKKELAKRLRVSEKKIELDKELPRIRWGRCVRFDWNEILSFLKSGRT